MSQIVDLRRITRVVITGAASLVVAAAAPSPDCERKLGPVAQAICTDGSLRHLDHVLAEEYAKASAWPEADAARLRRRHLDWLAYRDATCGPDPMPALGIGPLTTTRAWRTVCLSQVYQGQIDAFQADAANDKSSASEGDALCDLLMRFLPPLGTFVDGDAASVIAMRAGNYFTIDPAVNDSLLIERLVDSTAECPAIRLYQRTKSGRVQVKLPPGIGGYCGNVPITLWPSFSIAEVGGTLALLIRSGSYLTVIKRDPAGWGASCSIKLMLTPTYSVSKAFCEGASCTLLDHAAPHLAEFVTRGSGPEPTPGLVALWNAEAPQADEPRWLTMRRIGLATLRGEPFVVSRKETQETLTYFDDHNGTDYNAYDGVETPGEMTAFVPIKSGDELLLGKIGAFGFGCCRVSDTELLSVYRLTGDKLEPIAGFVLEPSGYRLAFADEV